MTYRTVHFEGSQRALEELLNEQGTEYDLVAVVGTLLVFTKRVDYARLVRAAYEAATACRLIESQGQGEYTLDNIASDLELAAREATGA